MLDGYGLHKLIWDACDGRFGDMLGLPPPPLPTSGILGSQCFNSCSTLLVGGNGTVCASSKTAYAYFRIDTASTPGCITIA